MVLLKSVEYICPIIVLAIIVVLKISIDNKVKIEKVKRIILEEPIDIMSLAISFVISYLISLVNRNDGKDISDQLTKGFICFSLYILFLVITVLVSKFFIRQYSRDEKIGYLLLGTIIGYSIAVSCTYYSISLLQSLGGV